MTKRRTTQNPRQPPGAKCSYGHQDNTKSGIVLEVPHATKQKSKRQYEGGRTQTERAHRPKPDQIEPGAKRGRNQAKAQQRAVSMRHAEKVTPDRIVKQSGNPESE